MSFNNIQMGNGVIISDNKVIINGVESPTPPTKGNNTTIIDNNVFIDGYEFKDGKWKKTLKALWHLYS